jgi:hypothetical protein
VRQKNINDSGCYVGEENTLEKSLELKDNITNGKT